MSSMIRNATAILLFKALVLIALAPCGLASAATNTLDEAVLQTQQEIKTELEALTALRADIARQRAPISDRHRELAAAVRAKRETVEHTREAKRYGEQQRKALNADVVQLEEECQFALTALSEYRRGLETRLTAAEMQRYRHSLDAVDASLAAATDFSRLSMAAEALLPKAAQWGRDRMGGHRFNGAALNSVGLEERGAFLVMGPICYFSNTNGVGGLVLTQFGSDSPAYYDRHTPQQRDAITFLLAGAEVTVPLDVSNGDGLRISEAGDSLSEQIGKGGFVMVPLLLIGVMAIALTLWKLLELRGMRQAPTAPLDSIMKHLESGDIDQATRAARALHAPLSTLIEEALAYRDSPREHLEEILHERILAMVPRLERHLGTLAVFGGVAPLLGLLGTMTGMIHTFDLVTLFGTGEARLLSGGISEALITTKFGLAVAIPVLLVHAFLARRVRTIIGGLENAAVRFVNMLKIGAPTP